MLTTTMFEKAEAIENSKRELYQMIEEGFQAIQEGRVCTIEEVQEELNILRAKLG